MNRIDYRALSAGLWCVLSLGFAGCDVSAETTSQPTSTPSSQTVGDTDGWSQQLAELTWISATLPSVETVTGSWVAVGIWSTVPGQNAWNPGGALATDGDFRREYTFEYDMAAEFSPSELRYTERWASGAGRFERTRVVGRGMSLEDDIPEYMGHGNPARALSCRYHVTSSELLVCNFQDENGVLNWLCLNRLGVDDPNACTL